MTMYAEIFPIEMRCAFSIRLRDDNVALFNYQSDLYSRIHFVNVNEAFLARRSKKNLVKYFTPVLELVLVSSALLFGPRGIISWKLLECHIEASAIFAAPSSSGSRLQEQRTLKSLLP